MGIRSKVENHLKSHPEVNIVDRRGYFDFSEFYVVPKHSTDSRGESEWAKLDWAELNSLLERLVPDGVSTTKVCPSRRGKYSVCTNFGAGMVEGVRRIGYVAFSEDIGEEVISSPYRHSRRRVIERTLVYLFPDRGAVKYCTKTADGILLL